MRRFLLVAILAAMSLLIGFPTAVHADLAHIRVAQAAPFGPITLGSLYGPTTFGKDFGVTVTKDDYTIFDSHVVAVQAVLAGQADVLSGSFLSALVLRESGQDFKVFCPVTSQSDHVLVGRNGITTLQQVTDPKTRVGIDSPGGGGSTLLSALFIINNIKMRVSDLQNTKLLESITLRASAWTANQVDVTSFRLSQFRAAQKDVPDGVIIARPYAELPHYNFAAMYAPTAWLTANPAAAAGFCAAVLKGDLELLKSYDAFAATLKVVTKAPVPEATIRESYDLIKNYGFWAPSASMSDDAIAFMGKVGVESGVLSAAPAASDIIDRGTFTAALQLLSADDRAALEAKPSLASTAVATQQP